MYQNNESLKTVNRISSYSDKSVSDRLEYYKESYNLFKENPFIGIGIGNWKIKSLKNYSKKFEIIESVGVLHHMKEPITGWQILSNILKPHGLLMIGLYSEKARQHIKRIRSIIKNLNYEINDKNTLKKKKVTLAQNSS